MRRIADDKVHELIFQPVAVIIRHTYGTANSVDVAFHPLGKPEETHGLRVAILNVVNQESVVGELVIDPELNPKRDCESPYLPLHPNGSLLNTIDKCAELTAQGSSSIASTR